MDGYTKISAEVRYADGEISRVEIHANAWDLNGDRVGNMLEQLMLAMGFHPSTVAGVFGDDNELYSEAVVDLYPNAPPPPYPYEEPIDMTGGAPVGEPLARVFADMDKGLDECLFCDESCDDTACLHANDPGPILDTDEDREEFFNSESRMPRDWHEGDGDTE